MQWFGELLLSHLRSPTIHTLGNVGFWGALHAALAPLSTKLIDVLAYGGQDVRQMVRKKKVNDLNLPIADDFPFALGGKRTFAEGQIFKGSRGRSLLRCRNFDKSTSPRVP